MEKVNVTTMEGQRTSPQITKMGTIDVSSANFTLANGSAFLIKNDNEEPVTVEIKPVNNDEFVQTVLCVGWNPEIVKEVKANAGVAGLKWGV